MFSAFTNSLKIPELRQRILFTLGMLFVARVGANIPVPGVDPRPLQEFFANSPDGGGLVGLYDMFTGGALLQMAVFALGIMPYISASIILQLMGAVVPALARLQQEGDIGRQKISQYTRYLTLAICLVQGTLICWALAINPQNVIPGFSVQEYGPVVLIDPVWFLLSAVLIMTVGSCILMWLGEQITQRGIGNGISLLITVGILADLPSALNMFYSMLIAPAGVDAKLNAPQAIMMIVFLIVVIAGITAVTQAMRKVPVQYAKRVVGRKVMGGQSSFLPLKVNYAGVMPVIFASAIIMFPQMLLGTLGGAGEYPFLTRMAEWLSYGHWFHYVFFGSLILGFSYFWVSLMFRPIQIADDLKKNGGYIPGVRPGEPTARFLDHVMTRLTLAGAIFLTVIAIMPTMLSSSYDIPFKLSQFFGGTSMLIAVGVMLDTMRQVETFLLQRHYDGFLKKGRSRSRSSARTQVVDTSELKNLGILWYPLGALFIFGIIAWFIQNM